MNGDGVHSVDIVVKRAGVAQLTRVSRPGDVEAVLALMRGLVDRDAGRSDADTADEEAAARRAAEAASAG